MLKVLWSIILLSIIVHYPLFNALDPHLTTHFNEYDVSFMKLSNAILRTTGPNRLVCIHFDVYENITGYLKNHWTKHSLICTHFDAFSMLILNMDIKFKNSKIFEILNLTSRLRSTSVLEELASLLLLSISFILILILIGSGGEKWTC